MKIVKGKYYVDKTLPILVKVEKLRGGLIYYKRITYTYFGKHSTVHLVKYHNWDSVVKDRFTRTYRPISKLERILKFGNLK